MPVPVYRGADIGMTQLQRHKRRRDPGPKHDRRRHVPKAVGGRRPAHRRGDQCVPVALD